MNVYTLNCSPLKRWDLPVTFLIVSDFIKAGRDIGVFIGPGRGSAAGQWLLIVLASPILIRSNTICCLKDS